MAGISSAEEKPDLIAAMQQWGVAVTLRPGQKRVSLRCPFHEDRGRPNMSAWLDSQTFYCFRCQRGGDVYDFVGRAIFGDRWNPRDRVMFLEVVNRETTQKIPARKVHKIQVEKTVQREVVQVLGLAAKVYHMALMGRSGAAARSVLIQRGIDLQAMRRYNLGYATQGALAGVLASYPGGLRAAADAAGLFYEGREWLQGRIIFPDLGRDGRVLNLAGRAVQKNAYLRYLSLPGLPKTIWGLRNISATLPVIVLESLPDAVNLRQMGFQGIAVNGTGIAWYLIPKLAKIPILVWLPQNDRAASEALERWQKKIPKARSLVIPYQPHEKDINDIVRHRGQPATREILTRALDAVGIRIG